MRRKQFKGLGFGTFLEFEVWLTTGLLLWTILFSLLGQGLRVEGFTGWGGKGVLRYFGRGRYFLKWAWLGDYQVLLRGIFGALPLNPPSPYD